MAYDVRITTAAAHAIDKLSSGVQTALLARLDELADDPRPHDSEKLKAMPKPYKVYRVPLRTNESSFCIVSGERQRAVVACAEGRRSQGSVRARLRPEAAASLA